MPTSKEIKLSQSMLTLFNKTNFRVSSELQPLFLQIPHIWYGILLFGCAGGPIKTATKFTTYEDFQPGPDGGVELVWARLGLRDADRLKSKLDDYDSVVIDQIFVLAKYVINYWVERLGDTLQNKDDAQKDRTMLEKENLIKLARMQMPFGKYAGRKLIDLPEEYLLWFANKKQFPSGELGDLMQLSLALKIEGLDSILKPLKYDKKP